MRAYGQRDPVIEYKKEAFALFQKMLDELHEDFVQRLFKVQLAPQAEQVIGTVPERPRQMVAQHAEAEQFGGAVATAEGEAPAPQAAPSQAQPIAPVRMGPRVGRNDPCPCGSGKKYKKCHGVNDTGADA